MSAGQSLPANSARGATGEGFRREYGDKRQVLPARRLGVGQVQCDKKSDPHRVGFKNVGNDPRGITDLLGWANSFGSLAMCGRTIT